MPKMVQNVIQIDEHLYSPTTTWYCESASELLEIPASATSGSIAMILTNSGLEIKMKNSQGIWIDI